jgi:DNA polymerase I-like protein with 3'-5' exonuclease and polymerase domains
MMEEGDTLLVLGAKLLGALQTAGKLPKGRKISSMRSKRHEVNGKSVFVTFDPTIIDIDSTKEPEIKWDVQLAARWVTKGSLMPDLGSYEYVEDFSRAMTHVALHGTPENPVFLSLDLETMGLDEFATGVQIVSIAITYKAGSSEVYQVPEGGVLPEFVRQNLVILCQSVRVKMTGANLKFDARWILQHYGIEITNQTFDTCLVGSILNENRTNSLNYHAKIYTDMGGYDDPFNLKYDKGKMKENLAENPEDFLIYSGGDTDACYRATTPLRNELLNDSRLTNFYMRLLQPAANAFTMMEHRGVVIDEPRYDELEIVVQKELARLHKEILHLMPGRITMKYADNLSIKRQVVLQDYLFSKLGLNLPVLMLTEKTQKPSTAMEHLEMHAENPKAGAFIDLMREFNSASKTMSTYITGFRKHLRPDGKFHPSYLLHRGDYDGGEAGTVTGRLSCKDPAYQTVPKHTKWAAPLRSVYVPPPGYAILKGDYSQGELRVTACIANEQNMIQTYKDKIDLHLKTGSAVYGITLEQALKMTAAKDPMIKSIRQGGKAGNFGLIYGMGANGFQDYARKSYGVSLSMPQVNKFIDDFFKMYPGLVTWHADAKAFAKRHGHVRSPLGRIRHLPLIKSSDNEVRSKAERMAINSPVQSCLSDMTLLAIAILKEMYPDLWVFGMTHDEIQMYVPVDELETWAYRVKDVMENLPLKEYFGWSPQVDFIADFEMSTTNLAECEEMELTLP